MADFKLISDFTPSGDQPRAINELADGINSNIVLVFAVTEQGIGHKRISCFIK